MFDEDQIVPEPLMDRVFDDAAVIDEMQADETKEYIKEEETAPLGKVFQLKSLSRKEKED